MSDKRLEELIKDGSLSESLANQQVILGPGEYAYLHAKPGRSYILTATDISASYPAIINVKVEGPQGWVANPDSLEPHNSKTFFIKKMTPGGVLLINEPIPQDPPGQPKVLFTLHHA